MNTCSVPDCDRPYRCSGYCDAHYRRYRRSGDAEVGGEVRDRLGGTPAERFEAKTLKTDGCWLWQGRPNGSGYGTFKSEDGAVMAHHYALKLAGTEVPTGMQVDHLCRVPLCPLFVGGSLFAQQGGNAHTCIRVVQVAHEVVTFHCQLLVQGVGWCFVE